MNFETKQQFYFILLGTTAYLLLGHIDRINIGQSQSSYPRIIFHLSQLA